MKRTLTSIMSLLLSFIIVLSAFPITASAATVGSITGIFLAENTSEPIQDLEITLQDANRSVVATTTTDSTGKFLFDACPIGEYYIIPTGAAYHGFDDEYLDTNGYYVIVVSEGENTFFKGGNTRYLRETLGSGKLIKVERDTNKPIPGTVFEFYDSSDNLINTYTTDANGEIVVSNLSLGTYYFLEKTPAAGYFDSEEKAIINVVDSSEATVTVINDPICSVTLIKTDRDTGEPLPGAYFELRNAADEFFGSYTTNETGTLYIDNLPADSYKLIESAPPSNYYIENSGVYDFVLSPTSPNKTIYATNAALPKVYITKVCSETGAVLDGALVDILKGTEVVYKDLELVGETMVLLEPGTYSIVETAAPAGYVLDSNASEFIVVDDATVKNEVVVENNPIVLNVNKYGEDKNGSVDYNGLKYSYLSGCEFVLTNKNDSNISYTWTSSNGVQEIMAIPAGTYELKELSAPNLYVLNSEPILVEVVESNTPTVVDVYNNIKQFEITIDKVNPVGKYVFTSFDIENDDVVIDTFHAGSYKISLRPGEYTVVEKVAPAGYAKAPEFSFVLDENGVITTSADFVEIDNLTITIINNPIVLNISKVDSETDVLLSGATLKLSKTDGTFEKTFVTNGNIVTINEGLVPGEYILEETVAPDRYALANPLTFTILDTANPQSIVLENTRMLGTIVVNKTGETLKNVGLVEKVSGFFANIFEVISGQTPLSGVDFTLYADEDILHPDGKTGIIYNKGDVVSTGTTDSYGLVTFKDLPFGKYSLVETDAPDGYYTTETTRTITVNTDTAINLNIENYIKTIIVNITKTDSSDTNKTLAGAVYGLYAKEDILASDGTVIVPKDSLIDVCETDANGTAQIKTNTPVGTYLVKEIKAPSGYVLSTNEKEITFDISDLTTSEYTENVSFSNDAIVATFEKLDKTSSSPIIGAKMQLLNEDGSVYAEWVTDANTKTLYAIPAGNYVLKEIEAPVGYVAAADMNIVVESVSTVQNFTMYDERVTGSATLNKFVKGTSIPLPGVTFELYNETLNMFVGTFTTNSSGQVFVDNLPVATYSGGVASGHMSYKFTEISTQPGYILDSNPYRFMLNAADPSYAVETDIVMNLENDYTKVHFYKVDKGNGQNIMGAELSIYPSTEFDTTTGELLPGAVPYATWLSGLDAYVVEKLPVGDYLLVETSAPDGYIKADNMIFAVDSVGSVQDIVLENDFIKVEISKFAEDGQTFLPGAKFEIYERSEFYDNLTLRDDAVPYDTWESRNSPHTLFKIPVGDYLLVETEAPAGYIASKPKLVTVVETESVQSVSVTNDVTKVQISKQDITNGKELPGALLSIYTENDIDAATNQPLENATPVASWESTNVPHYIEKLPVGNYVLVEDMAPAGYVKSHNVKFTIDETAEIQPVYMYDDIITVVFTKFDVETRDVLPGAEFDIYTVDDSGNPATKFASWTSTDSSHVIERMPAGQYVLIETKAPEGYATADDIYFEVKETANVQYLNIYNTKTKITLSKESESSEILSDAVFDVYPESQFDSNLKLIDNAVPVYTWTSKDVAEEFRGIPVGKYLFVETQAPLGYVPCEPQLVEVKDTPNKQDFVFVNEPIRVGIYKVDSKTGDTVSGAKLALYEAESYVDGNFVENPIAEWTTTYDLKEFKALPAGDYIIRELSVPDGYTTAEPLMIVVEETAELQIFNLANSKTVVNISKLDKDTKEHLSGVSFELYHDVNDNGKVDDSDTRVDSWTTDGDTHVIEGLPVGMYILVETKAPDGYKKNGNISINVRDTSDVQIFEIVNEKVTPPQEIPHTGDQSVYIISGIFLTAGLVLTLAVLTKKNKIKTK